MSNTPNELRTLRPRTGVRPTSPSAVLALVVLMSGPSAVLAQNRLGTAQNFGVLGDQTVTNIGETTIKGDLGVSPGTSITGLGPGANAITLEGTVHQTDGVALQAQADAVFAYNALAALPFTENFSGMDLGGMTLTPGVYFFSSSAQLTGELILDFQGDPNAEFVFQIGSTLTTASASTVSYINGGGAGNGVYWQVGSSATLGTSSVFLGNIIALASVTMTTSAKIVCGRAIALNGAVTMDNNVISGDCSEGGDFGTGNDDLGSLGFSGGPVPGGPRPNVSVPEPSILLLLGTGLTALALAAWRRRGTSVYRV